MVHHEQEYMVRAAQSNQACSNQRAAGKIERATGLLIDQMLGLLQLLCPWRQLRDIQFQLTRRGDHLLQRSFGIPETGPQSLMASHNGVYGLLQGRSVQLAAQSQGHRYVIGMTSRLQLVQKPQALLDERHRHFSLAGRWLDRQHWRSIPGPLTRGQCLGKGGDGWTSENRR